MPLKATFRVNAVEAVTSEPGARSVRLVHAGDEVLGAPEGIEWAPWLSCPGGGAIRLVLDDPEAFDIFTFGAEISVTFEGADPPETK